MRGSRLRARSRPVRPFSTRVRAARRPGASLSRLSGPPVWFCPGARRRARRSRSCRGGAGSRGSQLALGQAAATSSSAGPRAPDSSVATGTSLSRLACLGLSGCREVTPVPGGAPLLQSRQKKLEALRVSKLECAMFADFPCVVFRIAAPGRDVEAATQTSQTRWEVLGDPS